MRGLIVRIVPVGALALLTLITGCAGGSAARNVVLVSPAETAPYRIQPGDGLDVQFKYHPDDSQQVNVTRGGHIALPVTGELDAAGLTLGELEKLIQARASRFLRDPVVSVSVAESRARAYIGGEVAAPGFVSLTKPMTVLQAILERGGFTVGANLSDVVVLSQAAGKPAARRLDLNERIKDGTTEGMVLAPDEVVLIPKTGIAKAGEWVNQWLNGMTPQALRQVRFGTIEIVD
jgi:polysaccharide export outer membrane protein